MPAASHLAVPRLRLRRFASIAAHEQFCAAGDCVISAIFDQSPQGNHLRQRISDGAVEKPRCRSKWRFAQQPE